MSKSKRERAQGLRCSLMPGEVFKTKAQAAEMRLTRQTNVALGGMVQVNYLIKKCRCHRFHLLTEQHLTEWEAGRSSSEGTA